jgi:protein-tyrosine phosphatase
MIKNILIVCVGNICRSPMGEALLANKLAEAGCDMHVSSAGIGALVGKHADPIAQELMFEKGIDISQHRARQATSDILFASDLILTMTIGQQRDIECRIPSIRGRVLRLGKWREYDILDPYKRPRIVFEQALMLIENGVDDWYRKLRN